MIIRFISSRVNYYFSFDLFGFCNGKALSASPRDIAKGRALKENLVACTQCSSQYTY
jgi:hypothetical protein